MPCEHQYAFTEPLPELVHFDPANRDDEVESGRLPACKISFTYFPTTLGSLWHWELLAPATSGQPSQVEEDRESTPSPQRIWNNHGSALRKFFLPCKADRSLVPSMASLPFPVDGYPILGEAHHIKGLWTALGSWLTHAGGVGKGDCRVDDPRRE